jgi:hypothetical protein
MLSVSFEASCDKIYEPWQRDNKDVQKGIPEKEKKVLIYVCVGMEKYQCLWPFEPV